MLRKSAKGMSKNPELALLRQWIFAHNADSRGISISTAAYTCQPGLLFSPSASLICGSLLLQVASQKTSTAYSKGNIRPLRFYCSSSQIFFRLSVIIHQPPPESPLRADMWRRRRNSYAAMSCVMRENPLSERSEFWIFSHVFSREAQH